MYVEETQEGRLFISDVRGTQYRGSCKSVSHALGTACNYISATAHLLAMSFDKCGVELFAKDTLGVSMLALYAVIRVLLSYGVK